MFSTHISSNKTFFKTFQKELIEGLFKRFTMLPYSLHFWYINIIDVKSHDNYSVIVPHTDTPCYFNGSYVHLPKNHYYYLLFNFQTGKFKRYSGALKLTESSLQINGLIIKVVNNSLLVDINGKEFVFDTLLPDSYYADFKSMYTWYNVNCRNKNVYAIAQNVVLRGPLVPWMWLHFYLSDGTFIKVFDAVGQRRELRYNDVYLPLDFIKNEENHITYFASNSDGQFIMLRLKKDTRITTTFQPLLSPKWEYSQYKVSLEALRTNIPGLTADSGSGIQEIATGFAL